MMRPGILLIGLLLLSGCSGVAHHGQGTAEMTPPDTATLLSGSALFDRPVRESELPTPALMELSPEMESFLAGIRPGAAPQLRLAALIDAFEAQQFSVVYDADATLTASQTFHQQRGNCLAFTLMMVAMARELGASAYFNEVEVPPVWGNDDEQTFVVYRHINMVSKSARGRRVVDFNLEAYDPVYDQRKLSDTKAFAQFYSNRGVELMQEGEIRPAFLHFRKALSLNPASTDLWSNLGVLYSRANQPALAEQSYQQALQLDPGHLVAISNLERLFRADGRLELADAYASRARYHRQRNPYYLYFQARSAYEGGEYKLASQQLRRALRMYSDDHRFHFLMGLTRLRLGEPKKSREHLSQAFLLVSNPSVENIYARKLMAISEGELQLESPSRPADDSRVRSGHRFRGMLDWRNRVH